MGVDPLIPQKEEEVFFAYGVQTNVEAGDSVENSVERIQLWILEDVANQLLLCPNDGGSISGRLLKYDKGGQFEQTVSRVYYMEDIAVATLSKILGSFCTVCYSQDVIFHVACLYFILALGKCTPTFGNATECAIVQSSIYLTANFDNRQQARVDALSVIHDRLGRGSYEKGAILHLSYLGPDISNLDAIGSKNVESIKNPSGSSKPITFYIAIGAVSLAACSLAAFLIMIMRVRKERKMASMTSPNRAGYQQTPTALDATHFSHPPSSKSFRDSSQTYFNYVNKI